MSEQFDWAMTALHLDTEADAEKWFDAVCDAYQAPGTDSPMTDWVLFVQQLYETAEQAGFDNEKVNWFTEGLADRTTDPLAVVKEMNDDKSGLARKYLDLAAAGSGDADDHADHAEEPGEPDEAGEWAKHTPAVWYEHLTKTMSEGWTGWKGTEADWAAFWGQFVTNAEQVGVQGPATEFLTTIHESPDRIAAFAKHGITIVTEWSKYPPAQWYTHLTQTLGDGWMGWDGTEGSWDQFQAWFLSFAEQVEVREPAALFLAEIAKSGDKVAAFAKHGIVIAVAAEAPDGEQVPADDAVRDAVAEAQTAMEQIIAEHPELAGMSAEAREQALVDALQEFVETGG